MRAEQLTGQVAFHGEGPVWSDGWGGLRCVDMLAGDVLSLQDSGRVERLHVGEIAAAVRPRAGGGAVIGVERGFALENTSGEIERLPEVWTDAGVRMNEGACDPDGRFWCGSMAYDKRPGAAALYRLDPDRTVTVALDGITISNGLDWAPAGDKTYYVDTDTGAISVFDYDAGSGLANRRTLAQMPRSDGRFDGLTVDSEGGVWVAVNHAGKVHRYSADGALEAIVELPCKEVTACTLGGAGGTELFITTSRENDEGDPYAGSIFRAEAGVAGQATRAFAG